MKKFIMCEGDEMYYNDFILENLKSNEVTLIGFADLSRMDSKVRHGFRYAIVLAMALDPFVLSKIATGPHIYYYKQLEMTDKNLRRIGQRIEKLITEQGFKALCEDHVEYEFGEKLPNKTIATRAGIGWIGKNAEVVNEEYGNGLRVTSILTNMPFVTDKPVNYSKCGECKICVESCPAKAINNVNWTIKNETNNLLKSRECKETMVERGLAFNLIYGMCDICIAACPYTKRYIKSCFDDEYKYFKVDKEKPYYLEKELL